MPFKDQINQIQALLSQATLAILVWGSGAGSPKDYEKREKIRRVLADFFPRAEVKFSEDRDLREVIPGRGEITVAQEELWELGACDMCIALDTSAGVGQEIAHFVNTIWAHKLLILTHERYKGSTSFPASLRESQNQIFYSDAEYDSCSLCGRVLEHAKQVALSKFSKIGIA